MYGYVQVDKSKLSQGEFAMYHAFFCSLCVSTKKQFGNVCRLATNYDITFFNVLFHSFLQKDVEIYNSKCVASPVKKRSMVQNDELIDRLAAGNILLMYVNLYDDVLDEGNFKKKIALKTLRKYYKKAKKLYPEMDEAIWRTYLQLRDLEKKNCEILDEVCHPFAELSRVFCKIILGEQSNDYIENLCYNLGKWIYLIDALDDLEKDAKKDHYNPLIRCFGGFTTAEQFLRKHEETLRFVFYTTLNKIAESYNDLGLGKYICVLKNVIYVSIREKTKQLLNRYRKGEKNEQSL